MEDLQLIGKEVTNINDIESNKREEFRLKINEKTHYLEIGAVVSDMSDGNIVFKYKVKDRFKTIFSNSGLVEPLAFPLLHPFGELGYDSNINKKYKFLEYMVSRWLMPEASYYSFEERNGLIGDENVYICNDKNINGDYVLMSINKLGNAIIPTNRFQIMCRLAQYHLVDGLSRSIDYKLKWFDKNRGLIFGQKDNTYDDYYMENDMEMSCSNIEDLAMQKSLKRNMEREEYSNSNPSFLAGSFHGGPRHLKQLATSALVIVSQLGDPTIFLTATCNPLWVEILTLILPGQTAFDRPDVTVRIFKRKLKKLLNNLRNGYYFGNSKIVYELRVIEYQHRGLPHAHVVFKLSDTPSRDDNDGCYKWIDHWISAELPDPIEQKELYCAVSNHMLHECSNRVNGCIGKNGLCKKGFKYTYIFIIYINLKGFSNLNIREKTSFDEKGYPLYRKKKKEDLNVVSYHKQILLDWNGHVNVAYCGKSYVVLYLYKYLFKGNKKVKILFDNTDDLHEKDEINHYIRGRFICSMDAMWRSFGYQTYPASSPSITLIKVKLPDHVMAITGEGKMCDLEIYFRRPLCFKDLKYTEFFDQYDYSYTYPKKYKYCYGIEEFDNQFISNKVFNMTIKCYDLLRSSKNKTLYIYKRLNSEKSITRMSMVYVYMGEIYYLRLLLLNVAAFGYKELLTYDNITYELFQHAAVARCLVMDDKLGIECYKEAYPFSTPWERRQLFVLLTLQGYPTVGIYDNDDLRFTLYEDYYYNSIERSHNISNNQLLEQLQIRFQEANRTLNEFGLPNPISCKTELERALLKYDVKEEWEKLMLFNRTIPNNIEQQNVLNNIYKAIDKGESKIYFLQGQAGSGKTTIAKKIIHYARSKKKIVLGCAATALAAQNYDEFDTFHGLFKYPVIEDLEDIDQIDDITLNLHNYPERKELIEAASVII